MKRRHKHTVISEPLCSFKLAECQWVNYLEPKDRREAIEDKIDVIEERWRREKACTTGSPSFNRSLIKLGKDGIFYFDFDSITAKQMMLYRGYVEMIEILLDSQSRRKFLRWHLDSLCTLKLRGSASNLTHTHAMATTADLMLEDDVDQTEQRKYFSFPKTTTQTSS